jgi:hypothetical protein
MLGLPAASDLKPSTSSLRRSHVTARPSASSPHAPRQASSGAQQDGAPSQAPARPAALHRGSLVQSSGDLHRPPRSPWRGTQPPTALTGPPFLPAHTPRRRPSLRPPAARAQQRKGAECARQPRVRQRRQQRAVRGAVQPRGVQHVAGVVRAAGQHQRPGERQVDQALPGLRLGTAGSGGIRKRDRRGQEDVGPRIARQRG